MNDAFERIRIYGDPILRKNSRQVTEFDGKLADFVSSMIDFMFEKKGVGLAASQVGGLQRITVIDLSLGEEVDKIMTLINPEILEREGVSTFEEGCLSIPGVFEEVTRPDKIRFSYQDVDGEEHEADTDGFLAHVIQHEMDHMEGILFIDRIGTVKRALLAKTLKTMSEEGGKV